MKQFLINLLPNRIAWFFSRPYIAGDSMEQAIVKVDSLWKDGKLATVDLLGEAVSNKEEVEIMTNIYLELTRKLASKSKYASISVKPTALGITISKEYCMENLRRILANALSSNILVTMDMEDSSLTDITLEMYKDLLSEFSTFGIVLQSRLFRTEDDILNKIPADSRVRICIGIYLEPSEIALTDKRIMKEKIIDFSKLMLNKNIFVEIATHDEKTIRAALELFENRKISKDRVEFQFLLGVPRNNLQNELLEKGYNVRLYAPFSTHWKYGTAYVKRRFLENPQMGLYVAKNILSNKWIQLLILVTFLFFTVLLLIYYPF